MSEEKPQEEDTSLTGLFNAIKFQLAGITIAFLAGSMNYAFVLFADTDGHEFALSIPILATALFTIIWGEATLKSQMANIKDASPKTKETHAHKDISSQPYGLLRVMNFGLAVTLAISQLLILFR
ncbi:hypothetical protein OAI26_07935 [Sulfitobacter sp.]|nr:hypothetical protein [Sulfitobacter sp.]